MLGINIKGSWVREHKNATFYFQNSYIILKLFKLFSKFLTYPS